MYTLSKSTNPKKKFMIVTPNNKIIHFGAKGYKDYIYYSKNNKIKAEKKKKAYIARHSVNENFNDPNTAGFWSRWILWNKPTLLDSVIDIAEKLDTSIWIR